MELRLESVSTLQQPREQGLLEKGRGEKASEWPSPLCPSSLRVARRAYFIALNTFLVKDDLIFIRL